MLRFWVCLRSEAVMKTKKGKVILVTIFCALVLFVLFYFMICAGQDQGARDSQKKGETSVDDKKSAYYCIDNHNVYYRQKRKYKDNVEKLKNYYIKNHEAKYNLLWEKKGEDWYLDTSEWSFSLKGKGKEKAKALWSQKPCTLNQRRTAVRCPVVYYQGILWKLKFSQFQGGFIKIELYRVEITEKAKQKKQMASFFGVKEKHDIDICLRVGPSPIAEILSSPPSS